MEGRTLDRLAMFVVHLPGLSLRALDITIGIYRYTFPERKESIFREIIAYFFVFFSSFFGDRFVRA
jgi:hypothetical protein